MKFYPSCFGIADFTRFEFLNELWTDAGLPLYSYELRNMLS